MHVRTLAIILVILAIPTALAQLPWEITDQRCKNQVLDQFELCEKNTTSDRCAKLGALLKVATACDTAHCTCVPRVNKAFCGNNNREGIEVCDGTGPDLCPDYGALINLSLVCDPKTCGCKLNQSLPMDYNPVTLEALSNASERTAVCGDKKVEREEDCDPPNTLCTTYRKEAGVCTDKCKCIPPDLLDKEDELTASVASQNKTDTLAAPVSNTSINTSGILSSEPENETVETIEEENEPESGFFTWLLSWLAKLFS